MAKPLLAGNWKMHGTVQSAAQLARQLAVGTGTLPELIVLPSYVCIPAVIAELQANTTIQVGAQNLSQYEQGAYTGEISGQMLSSLGCSHVLVGHSERRQLLAEDNQLVAEKFVAAQKVGLKPILCVGETLQQRQNGLALQVIDKQIAAVVDLAGLQNVCAGVIAYEPVWAVGTGETATPEQAQEVHSYIRNQLGAQGASTQLLYGGSVTANNATALFAQPDIDGGLVGGASLEAEQFLNIAQQMVEQK
jgi:triosephosphate isomerase